MYTYINISIPLAHVQEAERENLYVIDTAEQKKKKKAIIHLCRSLSQYIYVYIQIYIHIYMYV